MAEKLAPDGPAWMQGVGTRQHAARLYRRVLRDIFKSQGVIGATDLALTAGGAMNVSVAAGHAIIFGTEAVDQGAYAVYNDAAVLKAVAVANPSNPRIDLVVAQVLDQEYSGITDSWAINVIAGTPGASPVQPATPNNAFVIGTVRVNVGDATVQAIRVFDTKPLAVPVRSGENFYQTAGGAIATISAETIVQTLTIPAQGYPYRVMLSGKMNGTCTVAGDTFYAAIRETNVAGTILAQSCAQGSAAGWHNHSLEVVHFDVTPDAAHTFVLTVLRASGTGTLTTFGEPYTRLTAQVMPL